MGTLGDTTRRSLATVIKSNTNAPRPVSRPLIQRNSAGIKAAWDLPPVPEGKRNATTTRPRVSTATATRRAPVATATATAAPAPAAATRPRPASAVTRRPSAAAAPPRVAKPRPASSKPRTLPPPPPADSEPPSPVDGAGITATHLDSLEGELRQALKEARKVYEDEKQLLRRHFKSVDDGDMAVDLQEFVQLWAKLHVSVSPHEARALFGKYAAPGATQLSYAQFESAFTDKRSRRGAGAGVRKGAFVAGQPATFQGKILYAQCRTGVFPPSNWDPALATRSAQVPEAQLTLEHVYGYGAPGVMSANLFVTDTEQVAFFTAGVGVVHDRTTNTQRFFLGHTDDVSSMALCPAAVALPGAPDRIPPRTLAATGQVTPVGGFPFVAVWDTRCPAEGALRTIELDSGARGVLALAFSPDGDTLAMVCADNQHTVYVWDWKKGKLLAEAKGATGEPPQVHGLVWDTFATAAGGPRRFVTFGVKHMRLWTEQADGSGSWSSTACTFGKLPMQNVCSAAFLPRATGAGGDGPVLATGMAGGELYVWKVAGGGAKGLRTLAAHGVGAGAGGSKAAATAAGVRGLCVRAARGTLVSAGADGTVHHWDLSGHGGLTVDCLKMTHKLPKAAPGEDPNRAICAVDVSPGSDTVVVGTAQSKVVEISGSGVCSTLVAGHSADLYQVCWHPGKPHLFASACESARVSLWDARTRTLQRSAPLGFAGHACAFSSSAVGGATGKHHLAVGGKHGHVKVVDETNLQTLWSAKECHGAISDLKYSPDNAYLAVASHDQVVDVYSVAKGYKRVARLSGHSATVRHVDWSADSSVLMTNCAGYEALYWSPRSCKPLMTDQRDTPWASWTCVLGFPVMGIWPDGSDGTDINAVDRSAAGDHLVAADDSGGVRLFNYPCVVEDAPSRLSNGHSAHVMCARFSPRDRWVVTAGGRDRAVFQFRFHDPARDSSEDRHSLASTPSQTACSSAIASPAVAIAASASSSAPPSPLLAAEVAEQWCSPTALESSAVASPVVSPRAAAAVSPPPPLDVFEDDDERVQRTAEGKENLRVTEEALLMATSADEVPVERPRTSARAHVRSSAEAATAPRSPSAQATRVSVSRRSREGKVAGVESQPQLRASGGGGGGVGGVRSSGGAPGAGGWRQHTNAKAPPPTVKDRLAKAKADADAAEQRMLAQMGAGVGGVAARAAALCPALDDDEAELLSSVFRPSSRGKPTPALRNSLGNISQSESDDGEF